MAHGSACPSRDRVDRAGRELLLLEREVLLLSAAERLASSEIALRTGLTPRQVRRVLKRAVRKLDRSLCKERAAELLESR